MVVRATRRGLVAGMLALGLALPLAAETPEASIARQLRAQGYGSVVVTRTLLGRLRFVASTDSVRREIIFNPRTGEILRDYSEKSGFGSVGPKIWDNTQPSTSGTAKSASEDDGEAGDDGEGDDGEGDDGGDDGEGDDGGDDGEGDDGGDDGEGDDGGDDGGEGDGEGDGEGGGDGEGDGEGDGGDD